MRFKIWLVMVDIASLVLSDVIYKPGSEPGYYTESPLEPYKPKEGWTLATSEPFNWDFRGQAIQFKTIGIEALQYCDVHLLDEDGWDIVVLTWETAGAGYSLTECTADIYITVFQKQVPSDEVKVWTMHKTDTYLSLDCNGVQVLYFVYETANKKNPKCKELMTSDVKGLRLNMYNNVIKSYRAVPADFTPVAGNTDPPVLKIIDDLTRLGPAPPHPGGYKYESTSGYEPPGVYEPTSITPDKEPKRQKLYHPDISSRYVLGERFGPRSLIDENLNTFTITDSGDVSWAVVWFSDNKKMSYMVHSVLVFHGTVSLFHRNIIRMIQVSLNDWIPSSKSYHSCLLDKKYHVANCEWKTGKNVYVTTNNDMLELSEIVVFTDQKAFYEESVEEAPVPFPGELLLELKIDLDKKVISSLKLR